MIFTTLADINNLKHFTILGFSSAYLVYNYYRKYSHISRQICQHSMEHQCICKSNTDVDHSYFVKCKQIEDVIFPVLDIDCGLQNGHDCHDFKHINLPCIMISSQKLPMNFIGYH